MTVVLEDLKNRVIEALGENLVCIFLTGSRIRGEERIDSDYDLAIIVSEIDEECFVNFGAYFSILQASLFTFWTRMI